jgi:hypothetical protein
MSSEFTTLALLTYSLALVGIFAFPSVRQRVPRVAVALLVIVPWAAALFAGALTHDDTYDVPPVLAIELHDPPRSEDPIIFDENGTEYVRVDRYDALSDNEKYMADYLPRATVVGESRRLDELVTDDFLVRPDTADDFDFMVRFGQPTATFVQDCRHTVTRCRSTIWNVCRREKRQVVVSDLQGKCRLSVRGCIWRMEGYSCEFDQVQCRNGSAPVRFLNYAVCE